MYDSVNAEDGEDDAQTEFEQDEELLERALRRRTVGIQLRIYALANAS